MTKEEISRWAYTGDKPDEPMNCAERCLWYTMRDIYRGFQSGSVTKEQGDAEKRKAFKQFEMDVGELAQAKALLARNANMWAEIELAHIAYNMDKTVENADAFVRAVYGVKMRQTKTRQQNADEAQSTDKA